MLVSDMFVEPPRVIVSRINPQKQSVITFPIQATFSFDMFDRFIYQLAPPARTLRFWKDVDVHVGRRKGDDFVGGDVRLDEEFVQSDIPRERSGCQGGDGKTLALVRPPAFLQFGFKGTGVGCAQYVAYDTLSVRVGRGSCGGNGGVG